MSKKSFDERRAALRQRVQYQLENNEQNILDEQSDVLPFEDEQEIVVKPMIDLDYDDRERLRMIVAILV